MANPTVFLGWAFPTFGQQSWYQTFNSFAAVVDISVHTLATYRGIANSVTAMPTARWSASSGGINMVGTTANVGAYVVFATDSFTQPNSWGGVAIEAVVRGYLVSTPAPSFGTHGLLRQRAVVNPGSITIPQSEGVRRVLHMTLADIQSEFYAVASLGRGKYSVSYEVSISNLSGTSSQFASTYRLAQAAALPTKAP